MIYSLYSFPPPFFPGPRAKTFSRLLFSALSQQLVIPKGKIVVAKTRGDNHVENYWAASGIIVDAQGQTLKSFTPNSQGDVVKTRSTIKPLHTSILYGLKDEFPIINTITAEEWAVLCSSHAGTDRHIKILEGLHSKFNLKESDLICGTHAPINQQSNERRLRDGKPLRNFHHQCSGHHTCLMILSKLLEYDYKDYWKLTGPLQQSLSKSLIKATGVKELKLTPYDGCNVPTISCNLKDYAVLYSKTVSKNQPLFDIVNLNADLIGDVDYLDPNLIKITNGRLFGKVGNDGLFVEPIRLIKV